MMSKKIIPLTDCGQLLSPQTREPAQSWSVLQSPSSWAQSLTSFLAQQWSPPLQVIGSVSREVCSTIIVCSESRVNDEVQTKDYPCTIKDTLTESGAVKSSRRYS